ncbi:hypothetical protein J4E93_004623 [Alternaria ventricosa]|uniref:uncharacterized protein n=1 Tax=Alternaria ventricosa TaxID=1187951 RepID=UPI0020C53D8A|nr:uncharacterized protein J4E93_004623 [Alternaria ventricosa]KAI4648211.1 hypothetical protein J4E93_004623 [Alternaria ventricosa]
MDPTSSARPDDALPNPGNTPEYLRSRTQSNARTRLLALPAEIREKVYKFTLVNNKEVTVYTGSAKFDRGLAPYALALLRTCRQIYIESRLVFYSGNTFKFPYVTLVHYYWAVNRMLSREQLETIQSVVFDEARLYGWTGTQCDFPWMVGMKTFPKLKKAVLRGLCPKQMLERDAVVGGSATWVEQLKIQKGIKLEVIIEDHSSPG